MFRFTARMEQHLEKDLNQYHQLFDGGRCSGWELEELIVRAIRSDTSKSLSVSWKEAGHDDKADIQIQDGSEHFELQVKSGRISKENLVLSGHRLGRYKGDFQRITSYLNNIGANMLSVPYKEINDEYGRHHVYSIHYIDKDYLKDISPSSWKTEGEAHTQTNKHGVHFSLRPSMSWQIWWKIPTSLLDGNRIIQIN